MRLLSVSLALFQCLLASAELIQVTIPSPPPTNYVVYSNFLGISFELSFMDHYCKSESLRYVTHGTFIRLLLQLATTHRRYLKQLQTTSLDFAHLLDRLILSVFA